MVSEKILEPAAYKFYALSYLIHEFEITKEWLKKLPNIIII